MILRLRERHDRLAVRQGEDAHLFAVETFFAAPLAPDVVAEPYTIEALVAAVT